MPFSTTENRYGDTSGIIGKGRTDGQLIEEYYASATVFIDYVIGDASRLEGNVRGGDDDIRLYFNSLTIGTTHKVIGDALELADHARGGDDTIRSSIWGGVFYGDALRMYGKSRGGDDVIVVDGANASLSGDAERLYDSSRGGDDLLIAHGDNGWIWGDAYEMSAGARGGDDVLVAGPGQSVLYGDAQVMRAGAVGGRDTFVIVHASGIVNIEDFRTGEDKIDLSELDVSGFDDLEITSSLGGYYVTGPDIFLEVRNVTLAGGPPPLTASDFIF